MRSRRLAVLVAFLGLCATACRADVVVQVAVEADGAGTVAVEVTLDDELRRALPEPERLVRTADLVDAGWSVADPIDSADGLTFRFEKRFAAPGALPDVLAEIGGAGRLVSGGPVIVEPGESRVAYGVDLRLDLGRTLDDLADPELQALLDGRALGADRADLEEAAGGPLEDRVEVTLLATLPGEVTGPTEVGGTLGTEAVELHPRSVVGDPTAAALRERADDLRDRARLAWVAIAGWAVLLVGAWLLWMRRRRRRRVATVEAVPAPEHVPFDPDDGPSPPTRVAVPVPPARVLVADGGTWSRRSDVIVVEARLAMFSAVDPGDPSTWEPGLVERRAWMDGVVRAVGRTGAAPHAEVVVGSVRHGVDVDELTLRRADGGRLDLRLVGRIGPGDVPVDLATALDPA